MRTPHPGRPLFPVLSASLNSILSIDLKLEITMEQDSPRDLCVAGNGIPGGSRHGAGATTLWRGGSLWFVLVLIRGDLQGDDHRGLGFIDKTWAVVHGASGGFIQFRFACRDQAEAVADVVDGVVREWVPVAGSGVGILGNIGQYPFHDAQDAFFFGRFFISHGSVCPD